MKDDGTVKLSPSFTGRSSDKWSCHVRKEIEDYRRTSLMYFVHCFKIKCCDQVRHGDGENRDRKNVRTLPFHSSLALQMVECLSRLLYMTQQIQKSHHEFNTFSKGKVEHLSECSIENIARQKRGASGEIKTIHQQTSFHESYHESRFSNA